MSRIKTVSHLFSKIRYYDTLNIFQSCTYNHFKNDKMQYIKVQKAIRSTIKIRFYLQQLMNTELIPVLSQSSF